MSDTPDASGPRVFALRLTPDGEPVPAFADQPLLAAALAAGAAMRSSCRNGTCRACLGRLRSGTVVYRIEWPGLSLDEKEDGFVLPCVAHPTSDIVLEAVAGR